MCVCAILGKQDGSEGDAKANSTKVILAERFAGHARRSKGVSINALPRDFDDDFLVLILWVKTL